jgi:hypothetical protein
VDHLRANRFPAHVYLNKLKESEYRAAFAAESRFELLDWVIARTEGEGLLTPEIERAIGGRYTRDDLLRREVIAIARRR